MSNEVVYLDRFTLREGALDRFRHYAERMARFVEENEPAALSYRFYVDDGGASGTALFVFADAEALDRHLDLAAPWFQEGQELLTGANIELLGAPSDRAVELARSFGGRVRGPLAGFTRRPA